MALMAGPDPTVTARNAFSPWTELAILCGYAALTLALGTVLLVRRAA